MPRSQSSILTRAHLEAAVSAIRGDIRQLVSHFNKSQGRQNTRLDIVDSHLGEMDMKLDAIMEMLATRKELKNFVRELRNHGIAIDAANVFVNDA